jgi:hypothetical protein
MRHIAAFAFPVGLFLLPSMLFGELQWLPVAGLIFGFVMSLLFQYPDGSVQSAQSSHSPNDAKGRFLFAAGFALLAAFLWLFASAHSGDLPTPLMRAGFQMLPWSIWGIAAGFLVFVVFKLSVKDRRA